MHADASTSPPDELRALEARIAALLPPQYVGRLDDIAPTSMGSAAMRYDSLGRIAWGEIWTSFCHLALAGGPPHRGKLLAPVRRAEVEAQPAAQLVVVAELQRAIKLTAALPIAANSPPGWLGVVCDDAATAAWLARAVTAENVGARADGNTLYVPVGPSFRIEKEVKNVVVSLAKSCHYLLDHVEPTDRPTGPGLTLIAPPLPDEIDEARDRYEAAAARLTRELQAAVPLAVTGRDDAGWLGLECGSDDAAVWMLRAVAVEDVLVRREESRLFVPISLDATVPDGIARTVAAVAQAYRLRQVKVATNSG